jgi:cysteine desulfurase/selenocysteine lyase
VTLPQDNPDIAKLQSQMNAAVKAHWKAFLFEGIHAHDISQVVDEAGVCVRAGHHCAKPLMRVLGVPATTRASTYVYNDEADVDALVEALATAERFFAI